MCIQSKDLSENNNYPSDGNIDNKNKKHKNTGKKVIFVYVKQVTITKVIKKV